MRTRWPANASLALDAKIAELEQVRTALRRLASRAPRRTEKPLPDHLRLRTRMRHDLIRPVRPDEHPRVLLEIINDAARRYRGVIPDDRWREPYMSEAQFAEELAAGVAFWAWSATAR